MLLTNTNFNLEEEDEKLDDGDGVDGMPPEAIDDESEEDENEPV